MQEKDGMISIPTMEMVNGVAHSSGLGEVLVDQRERGIDNSIYKACQCDFAYNSNRIEGSKLTHDATEFLWERDAVAEPASREDIQSAANHFILFDLILDLKAKPLTPEMWDSREFARSRMAMVA